MKRALIWTGVVLLLVPIILIGLLSTEPASRFVLRRVLPKLNEGLNGSITVDRIDGSLLGNMHLGGVAVRGPTGEVLASVERVEVDYAIRDLFSKRIVIEPLILERPVIRLLKEHPAQPYPLLEVFQGSDDPADASPSRLSIIVRRFEIEEGIVLLSVPGSDEAATANGEAVRMDTIRIEQLQAVLPLARYATDPNISGDSSRTALVEVARGSAHVPEPAPELVLRGLSGRVNLVSDSIAITLDSLLLPDSRLSARGWMVAVDSGRPRFEATVNIGQVVARDVLRFIGDREVPPDWHIHGDVQIASSGSAVSVRATNLDLTIAGGSARGRIAMTLGPKNHWAHRNSHLELENIALDPLFRAFDVDARLLGVVHGTLNADGAGDALVLHADMVVDSLRQGEPPYMPGGMEAAVGGRLVASGPLSALRFDTRLTGDLGGVQLAGTLGLGSVTLRNVSGQLDRVNLFWVSPRLPRSNLNGRFEGSMTYDGGKIQVGDLRLLIDSSSVRNAVIDTAAVSARLADGLVTVDSLLFEAPGLAAHGGGTFGVENRQGDLEVEVRADSLGELRPLLASISSGLDTLAPFAGALEIKMKATGALSQYAVEFDLTGKHVVAQQGAMRGAQVSGILTMPQRRVLITMAVDSARMSGVRLDSLNAFITGGRESLIWNTNAVVRHVGRVTAGGDVSLATGDSIQFRAIRLDSLTLEREAFKWMLERPAAIELVGAAWSFDSVLLARHPGPGRLIIAGRAPDPVTVALQRFPLWDLLNEEQRERAKQARDTLPDLEGRASYRDNTWSAQLALVTMERRPLVLDINTDPLSGRLTLDSFDLAVVGRVMPEFGPTTGRMAGSVDIAGSMRSPQLEGIITLNDGAVTVPGLNVRFARMAGGLRFGGDSVFIDNLSLRSRDGRGVINGSVRLPRLDQPELDLTMETSALPVMRRGDFVTATASARVSLHGPFSRATLTGRAAVDEGAVQAGEFLRRGIVELSDPLFAQFVDTTVLIREKLGQGPVERFVDSLAIDSMNVDLGPDFWMRTPDANIQLAGKLRVSKEGDQYLVYGTVNTVRGTYQLTMAPGMTREFTVKEGSIRYYGNPATDAELDITVEHKVEATHGDDLTVIAHLAGTMEVPRLELSSDAEPPLSESEVISYLLFGAPTVQAFLGAGSTGKRSLFEQSVERFVGVLSGQIEQVVVDQLGLPLDYFRIKPGEVQSGLQGTELLIGKNVELFGEPAFLRASPRLCPREQLLSLDQIGLSLEMHFAREWGVSASIDPIRGCEASAAGQATVPYQLGADIFWEFR